MIRQEAPAARRNCKPILDVLGRVLPAEGSVLEIASGTGQHVVAFAQTHPDIVWLPSDPRLDARQSIAAWVAETGVGNVAASFDLDVTLAGWASRVETGLAGVVCINMLHIAPWRACEGLMEGAAELLAAGGFLYLYGPYTRDGHHTAASNAAFDRSLKARNPDWGLRGVAAVAAVAGVHGFGLEEVVEMPANNLSLVFRPRPRSPHTTVTRNPDFYPGG